MKKKIIIILAILISVIIVIFAANITKEKIDANTKFALDTESKYIIDYITIPDSGGLASSNYYCEIDLEKELLDVRYDFQYFEGLTIVNDFQKMLNNKRRKLIKRYKLNSNQVQLFDEYLNKMKKENQDKDEIQDSNNELNRMINGYYSIKTQNKSFSIDNTEDKQELRKILNDIDKNINLY